MSDPHADWKYGPLRPSIGEDEVHVWRVSLEQPEEVWRSLFKTLATDERERAARFHFEKDRRHFVAARGTLRAILARYLAREAGEIRFSYTRHGKPSLADATVGALRFNLSHAAGVALCALTCGREVGVDVELIRKDFAGMDVAEHFFSAREVEALRALPPEIRAEAFFNCWTRKEAYIKALGEGLSHPLHSFSVPLAPGEPDTLLSADDDPEAVRAWTLKWLPVGGRYVAAAAVEGRGLRFEYLLWNDGGNAALSPKTS